MNKKSVFIAGRKLSRKADDLGENSATSAGFADGSLLVGIGLKTRYCGGSTREESRRMYNLP